MTDEIKSLQEQRSAALKASAEFEEKARAMRAEATSIKQEIEETQFARQSANAKIEEASEELESLMCESEKARLAIDDRIRQFDEAMQKHNADMEDALELAKKHWSSSGVQGVLAELKRLRGRVSDLESRTIWTLPWRSTQR